MTLRRFTDRLYACFACLWLVAFAGLPLWALDPSKHLSQYVHRVWQDSEGLPQNSVQAIVQGPDGYLWIATQEGLVQFDGVRFKIWDKLSHPILENHDIRAATTDDQGQIWFGNRAGSVFHLEGRTVREITLPTQGAPVTCMAWSRGSLWVGTLGAGLFRWDQETRKGVHVDQVYAPVVPCMLFDRSGNLWLGTKNEVLLCLKEDGRLLEFVPPVAVPFEVSALLEDRFGRIWIGTETSGLFTMVQSEMSAVALPLHQSEKSVAALLEDDDNNLWIATTGAGLMRLADDRLDRFDPGPSLSHEILGSLFEDHEGNLWVGTLGGGLNQYTDCSFVPYTSELGLKNETTWTVFPDGKGKFYVGTDGGHIYHFDGARFERFHADISTGVVVLGVVERAGITWIATDQAGVYKIAGETVTRLGTKELGTRFMSSFFMGPDGQVWLGSDGKGVFFLDGDQFVKVPGTDGLTVPAIISDGRDGIYAGTHSGVFHIHKSLSTFVEDIGSHHVNDLALDGLGNLWIGTFAEGLFGWDGNKLIHLMASDGLYDDSLFALTADARNGLWFTSNRGVYYLTREQINGFSMGLRSSVEVKSFTTKDGMKSLECNFLGGNSIWSDDEGHIWVPTMKGLVQVNPASRIVNNFAPRVRIEEMGYGDPLTLLLPGESVPEGTDHFEFHFTALSYKAPMGIHFRYRLLGYNDQWIDAGTDRVAFYSSLPAGQFTFEVEAVNEDGVHSVEAVRRSIAVVPPFYRRTWFIGLMALLAMGGLFVADRLRVRHHRKKSIEMESVVREKTRELDAIRDEIVHINQQLSENARIAGMAEMATEVLHNIGNALNTATTSATLLHQMLIDPTSVRVVSRIVKLISDHRDDLAEFISQHEQGSKMPDVLARLAPILAAKQEEFLLEVKVLREQLEHINDIIDSQQEVEWSSRTLEATDIPFLVENVVQMFAGRFGEQGIEINQDLKPLPQVSVYRSDFLQIMTNLVKNAGEAMSQNGSKRKTLTVKTYRRGPVVVVEVKDTGHGIVASELERLFEFGYSTKTDGHGFGLHYCARVIDRIGGVLRAESPGRGMGATFVIEIPIQPVENTRSIAMEQVNE
ncbi:MAG: GHKL domain-containing protein [Acidobacteria bacterium]|nr:GHKL domain-containing protein [Acidobacteriota bacterium]